MPKEEANPDLPVPTQHDRTYIRIRPTDTPLNAQTVATQLSRLHQQQLPKADAWYRRPFQSTRPTYETLLVSDGTTVMYYVGVDSDLADSTSRILRSLYPDTYEFSHQDWAPDSTLVDTEHLAAVEYLGQVGRPKDWQTKLTEFESFLTDEHARIPLATIVETMADADVPMVYQVLFRPRSDWTGERDERVLALEEQHETIGDQLTTAIFGPPEEPNLPVADEARVEELGERNPRRSFDVTARVAVADSRNRTSVERIANDLADAFSHVSHTSYEVTGRVRTDSKAQRVLDDIRNRTAIEPSYRRLRKRPWRRPESRGIVMDDTELGALTVVDGAALTDAGDRIIEPTPGERQTLQRPPQTILDEYTTRGLTLGKPLTEDATTESDPIALPEDLQPMHVAWFGKTGAGKSTALTSAMLDNHQATDGASILIDPKGDGMATDYMRAHYAKYGHLNNVLYFDCAETLPAFSFFDIRDQLDAGIPRTTAVEDSVDHYLEILGQVMGTDRFERAVRSPDVIRYMVKALYDPVNGSDAFSHSELHAAVRQLHERQTAPAVSDPDLERMLSGVTANSARSFDEIMQGVANRIEKIPVDQRLATIFEHVPEEGDPHFDLVDYLDENVVIILDTGSLRPAAQRVLTLVMLSNLWTALRRRLRQSDGDPPLANLYIEEAASVAVSDLLQELLAQARSFGCSVTLAMQFPAQLKEESGIYDEILNNVSTVVTGNVPRDRELAARLATDDMDAEDVGNRLRALQRGQWMVKLPAAYGQPEPRPFTVESVAPPAGHPAHDHTPSRSEEWEFQDAKLDVHERTLETAGLVLGSPSVRTDDAEEDVDESEDTDVVDESARVDSALPYTQRMPSTVDYEESIHALRCTECENRYDPDIMGMKRAISCCSSLDDTDRDDIPVCNLNLKLTPEERAVSGWSTDQLLFLQAVYNAQQLRYDTLEYDLLDDSMIRLQEYVGIDSGDVQDLIDEDLLRHDTDHPHRLFTVSPDGRKTIGESYRQGVDYGHGAGDLEESSHHVFAIEVGRLYLEQEYASNPESPVVEIVPYHDIDEGRRLDLAGVDADGEILVAAEAERVNHDIHRAVPEDFDKMADCGVDEAIWFVTNRRAGHAVLSVLNDPPEGEPRVEKTYSEGTPPQQFTIDTPGLTAIYPLGHVQGTLLDNDDSDTG